MKKILPLLILLFVFTWAGCNPTNTCPITGLTPNSTYLVVFDLGGGKEDAFFRQSDSNGTISARTKADCNDLITVVLFTTSNLSLSASPSSIYLPSPPSTATITGQSFDTTYGAPRVDYYDGNGYLVGSAYATSVSSDGTSLTASVPDLSGAYSGSYQIRVVNKTSQGYYSHTVGTATISAYGRDRYDSDSDGYYDDEDCDPYDPYRNTYCGGCPENPTAIICE
jgi:hypothetical protein